MAPEVHANHSAESTPFLIHPPADRRAGVQTDLPLTLYSRSSPKRDMEVQALFAEPGAYGSWGFCMARRLDEAPGSGCRHAQ
jgi:hypothetical protein